MPTVSKAGGFTLTSTPARARTPGPAGYRYLELAVQRSPENPPAAWLWGDHLNNSSSGGTAQQPGSDEAEETDDADADADAASSSSPLIGQALRVRVGGSFVWPPPALPAATSAAIRRVVFVAGGVGVNPLVSMACHIAEQRDWAGWGDRREGTTAAGDGDDDDETMPPFEVRFLYSIRDPGGDREADAMLFVQRLATLFSREKLRGKLRLFLTLPAGQSQGPPQGEGVVNCNEEDVPFVPRRITRADLEDALGPAAERRDAVVYVCGVPVMTDDFVRDLTTKEDEGGMGMSPERVFCEKWW